MNYAEIEHFCRSYFNDNRSLESSEKLSGGAVNGSFKIVWAGKAYVLRIYARNPQIAGFENDLYRFLGDRLPVPKLLYSQGSAALFEFIDKKRLDQVEDSSHSYFLGELLARIHQIRFPSAGLFGPGLEIAVPFEEGSSPYLEYILQNYGPKRRAWQRLGEDRGRSLRAFIERNRAFFPKIKNGGVLVHSDFKPVNLLWEARTGFTVLDWEFAHAGHPLMDFGILMRHDQEFPFELKAFEKGYRENGGELPEEWERMARTTDLINLIELLNRPQARDPELIAGVDRILRSETAC